MSKPFHVPIEIKQDDIDQMGHVNNVVYLRWVQEIAESHWTTKATKIQQSETLWVVLRHEIDYKAPAHEHDVLYGKTWVELPKGAKVSRHVEIINKNSDKILAKALTTWCAISGSSGKPKRIDQPLVDIFN